MRTVKTKVYKFGELSKEAKEKAIEKFYDINVDFEWWENVYEDFSELCKTIGLDIDLKKTYFMGFAYQGQGASFTADIDLIKFIEGINTKKYLEHAPQIEKEVRFNPDPLQIDVRVLNLIYSGIIEISIDLKANDRPYSTKVSIDINYSGNCSNYSNIEKHLSILENWIEETINDLDHCLFKLLENEYDYQTSEEAIIEAIEANEYKFTKDGKQF